MQTGKTQAIQVQVQSLPAVLKGLLGELLPEAPARVRAGLEWSLLAHPPMSEASDMATTQLLRQFSPACVKSAISPASIDG